MNKLSKVLYSIAALLFICSIIFSPFGFLMLLLIDLSDGQDKILQALVDSRQSFGGLRK